jgi:hypothetical protein
VAAASSAVTDRSSTPFSRHASLVFSYSALGTLANAEVNSAFSVQLKVEF